MTKDYGLPDPAALLPARPIAVRRHGFADRWRLPFLGAVLGLVSLGTIVTECPKLYQDYRVYRDPVSVEDASLASSQCRFRTFTVHCKAGIAYPKDGETKIRSVDFSFLSASSGNYATDIVAERGNPDNITLSLAIDQLWNRCLGALLIAGLLGACAILMLRRFVHMNATLKGLKEPAVLRPVWGRITLRTKKKKSNRVTYFPILGLRKGMGITSQFARSETPWMVYDAGQDETFALCAVHPDALLPIMLDEGFTRIDLTADEIAAARAVRAELERQVEAR
ncbi:hypothetical protein MTR62_04830 [Novosphingobium sp. 1949]|uniref:DUF3592 domain-containing protein n=1 Tax=Novosphingobium organovorum TaxID=2930092 RepID=A0ABT0BAF3_9SPHN|nr:hypothetical protein [Novosphingobium organovorum]MCJ2182029.1 hypothetical protein [Novosphingobium organovorum]